MYAIVQTGGKQYRVSEGDIINVEKLNVEAGSTVQLGDVLVIGDQDEMQVGKPVLENACVCAEVLENGKADKVYVYKYKAKKGYRKKQGHRQPYTKLQVKGIYADKTQAPKAEAKAAAKEENVNLNSLKKDELIALAKEQNVAVNTKMTKADIIAAIEAAK